MTIARSTSGISFFNRAFYNECSEETAPRVRSHQLHSAIHHLQFTIHKWGIAISNFQIPRGHSSVGRAPALQAGSQGFESPCLHSYSVEAKSTIRTHFRDATTGSVIALPSRRRRRRSADGDQLIVIGIGMAIARRHLTIHQSPVTIHPLPGDRQTGL